MKKLNMPFPMTSLFRGVTSGKIRVNAINTRGFGSIISSHAGAVPCYADGPFFHTLISETTHDLKPRTNLKDLFSDQLLGKTIRKIDCMDDLRMTANMLFRETATRESDMTLVWTGVPRTYALLDISRIFLYTDPYRDLGVIVSHHPKFELVVFSRNFIKTCFFNRVCKWGQE